MFRKYRFQVVVIGLLIIVMASVLFLTKEENALVFKVEWRDNDKTYVKQQKYVIEMNLLSLGYAGTKIEWFGDNSKFKLTVDKNETIKQDEIIELLSSREDFHIETPEKKVVLTRNQVKEVTCESGTTGDSKEREYNIVLHFTEEGRKAFYEATKEVSKNTDGNNYLSVKIQDIQDKELLRGTVESAVDGDNCIIYTTFNEDEAELFTRILNYGSGPVITLE